MAGRRRENRRIRFTPLEKLLSNPLETVFFLKILQTLDNAEFRVLKLSCKVNNTVSIK